MGRFICKSIKEIPLKEFEDFALRRETSGYLEGYLKKDALHDEYNNEMRTYIVIDDDTSEIVGYFSLKANIMAIEDDGVFLSLPMIELANFAVNDIYKEVHLDITGLGKMIVSDFVIPIIEKVSNLIGAWGVCIYSLPQEHLIEFYKSIGFVRLPEQYEKRLHQRVKPSYDKDCIFMYQKI